jgi:hypothetical protein
MSKFAETGSLIRTIEELSSGTGRDLVPFEPEEPNALERALAEKELLDPESADGDREPMARPGLLAGASPDRPGPGSPASPRPPEQLEGGEPSGSAGIAAAASARSAGLPRR